MVHVVHVVQPWTTWTTCTSDFGSRQYLRQRLRQLLNTLRPMIALAAFYEDERRRASDEVSWGSGWRDAGDELFRFNLFWIVETRELCLLRYPYREPYLTGSYQNWLSPVPLHAELSQVPDDLVAVEVLTTIDEERLENVLQGWEEEVWGGDGIRWVRERIASC